MTAKQELLDLVEHLDDADAAALLDYTRWLLSDEDDDELTEDEWTDVRRGEKQLAQGESITLGEYLSQSER